MSAAVVLEGITKSFPGVVANDDVNLTVELGEIHAISGENGAGKSTLMKILYGMQAPDKGRIVVEGREVSFSSPKDAIAAGIGMVHQHFMLADNLTVLENVILGAEPAHRGMIDFQEARDHLKQAQKRRAKILLTLRSEKSKDNFYERPEGSSYLLKRLLQA